MNHSKDESCRCSSFEPTFQYDSQPIQQPEGRVFFSLCFLSLVGSYERAFVRANQHWFVRTNVLFRAKGLPFVRSVGGQMLMRVGLLFVRMDLHSYEWTPIRTNELSFVRMEYGLEVVRLGHHFVRVEHISCELYLSFGQNVF